MIKVNCPNCSTRLTAPDELIGKPVVCQRCNTRFVLSKRWMNAPIAVPEGAVNADPRDNRGPSDELFRNQSLIGNDSDSSIHSSPLGIVAANFDPAEVENEYTSLYSDGTIPTKLTEDFAFAESSIPVIEQRPIEKREPAPVVPKRPAGFVEPAASKSERNAEGQAIAIAATQVKAPVGETYSTTPIKGFVETNLLFEFFDFRFRSYLAPGIIRLSWFLILIAATVSILFISYLYLSSLLNRQEFAFPTLKNGAEMTVDSGTAKGEVALVVPRFVYNSILYFGYASLFIVGMLWLRVLFESIIMVFSIGSHLRDSKSRR